MLYADVILPLKLQGNFTYAIPEHLVGEVVFGKRVVVQFGARRFYAAIVAEVHSRVPELHKPKTILSVVDGRPVVTTQQIALWKWMAHYYLCTIGEVMNAALPAALKLDSTTQVELNPEWNDEDAPLSNMEFAITETLRHEGILSLDDLAKTVELKRIHPLIHSLMQKGAVLVKEELQEKFKPRTTTYVRLAEALEDEDKLQLAAEGLKRSPKQLELLMKYLHLRDDMPKVPRSEILAGNATAGAQLKKLLEKNILEEYKEETGRLGKSNGGQIKDVVLGEQQQAALQQLKEQFAQYNTTLLHGVTSSGKTHLYIHLIKEVIAEGKQALFLLPEIALSAQVIDRLREYFGNEVGVYHSKFNDQERVEIWNKTLTGEYKVILGARSSLLLPFKDLGLIIVDEEHDGSYKQYDPAPRYHARDTAIYLAGMAGIKTLLGTATPSLESYHNATTGKYGLVTMSERYGGIQMPDIKLVNTRDEIKRKLMSSHFTSVLISEMEKALANNEQVILFQNKRGYSPYLVCTSCNWIPRCRNCDVSLTYHKFFDSLRCHYCGYGRELPHNCEECGQATMRIHGFGTEKIEEEIQVFFPKANIARLDLDTTRGKEGHKLVIDRFSNREIDVLVGTQMVTKGLDFGHVSLVGILSADQLLSYPDFRSHERAYQLMEQVAGRAGRRQKAGKVIVQTGDPEHPVVQFVLNHDFNGFYRHEMAGRKAFNYPPFTRLVQLTLKHKDRGTVLEAAQYLSHELKKDLRGILMGPTTPLIARVRNLYMQEILLKLKKDNKELQFNKDLIQFAINILKKNASFKSVEVLVDVDP